MRPINEEDEDRLAERAEHDRIAAPEAVGEPAADERSGKTAEAEGADREPNFRVGKPAPMQDDREERVHKRPEPVDERPDEQHPERARERPKLGQ
jgi:hypothetical protein